MASDAIGTNEEKRGGGPQDSRPSEDERTKEGAEQGEGKDSGIRSPAKE